MLRSGSRVLMGAPDIPNFDAPAPDAHDSWPTRRYSRKLDPSRRGAVKKNTSKCQRSNVHRVETLANYLHHYGMSSSMHI